MLIKRISRLPTIFLHLTLTILRYRLPFGFACAEASFSTSIINKTSMSNCQPQFWNRESSEPKNYDANAPVTKQARIIALSDPNDESNALLYEGGLPEGACLMATGSCIDDFDVSNLREKRANVVFVSHPNSKEPLAELLNLIPSIEWIHSRSAGIDFIVSPTLKRWQGKITNAKGHFSSTLAEYSMMACSYFAKDLPRLLKNKSQKNWSKYDVLELRGATFGVFGFGDIGRASAKLAAAYGMKIIALRRNPAPDALCDKVYGSDKQSLNKLFAECDYVLCAAPLTGGTKGIIGKEQFEHAKKGCVFINVGRGPIVDEEALIDALESGKIKGAGLDVFSIEPLPETSPLWDMENVLLSPHNMDRTATFMHEATVFFVNEALPRFVRDQELLNPVNAKDGY